ncbi:hypothetical protein GCM10011628_12620 [Lactobacillus acetotolerans DSM 20749 = JCM 3825]|jgi:hypothetical protein|nr:hypothetical protein GCM10011628_12620 [Lactobacillus acetotolerans DSM 20749 = JCM 3825]
MSGIKQFVYESLLHLLFNSSEYNHAANLLNSNNLHESLAVSHTGNVTTAHWIRID